MSNKIAKLYPGYEHKEVQGKIATVVEAQDGEARQVQIAGERLPVCGHFETVSLLRVNDQVAVMAVQEGVIVMARLRNAGERPSPLAVDRDGRLEIEAIGGISLKSGESRIEINADGRIWVDGREIYQISDGRMRLQGSTIELN